MAIQPSTDDAPSTDAPQPTGLEQFLFVALVYSWAGVLATLTFIAMQAYTHH